MTMLYPICVIMRCVIKGLHYSFILFAFYKVTFYSFNKIIKCSVACWVIFHAFLSSADFFQAYFFKKILSRIHVPLECQIV